MKSGELRGFLLAGAAAVAGLLASPALAATCTFEGGPQFGGIEPPLAVDGTCEDPDYNKGTLVIDSTEQKTLSLPDGSAIAYTEVKGHFPARRRQDELPAGITVSPTTAEHRVLWRFPEKKYFRNRFFQQTYPLNFPGMQHLNLVDDRFTFTSGGYMVSISPGSPNVGYRVPAAAAKLAKDYANTLYGNTKRIHGYLYGQSGGSVQSIGAAEGTTGVWDGIAPVVIAVDGLNMHSFMWDGLYALAIPEAKRQAIADAAAPGSGRDIHEGLNADERAVLDEVLKAGFPRIGLETMRFSLGMATIGAGAIRTHDPSYEDDFWSKPGYEGVDPRDYITAAKVDGYARIASIRRGADKVPTAITFQPGSVPALGSTGADGLQYYVYARDGVTRITKGEAISLSGKLEGDTLTLDPAKNDPALLAALVEGGRIRINNRFAIAAAFYPRHSILDNGSPSYDQYRNEDGTLKYVQRPAKPVNIAYLGNIRSAGGRRQTGHLKVKTVVVENLADTASYPLVGGLYAELVERAMGSRGAAETFRIYYQENAGHAASLENLPGKAGTMIAPVGGILHQALLDLAAWAERGTPPLPSTQYRRDAMNQVVLPESARERGGHQPLVRLTANGRERAEVGVNQEVNLVGEIAMPPRAGKLVEYDWYLGNGDFKFEPATKLARPLAKVSAARTIRFSKPGEYMITLRAAGQRDSLGDASGTTPLINIDRVRVVVR